MSTANATGRVRKQSVPAARFVSVYNTSNSAREVAEKLGIAQSSVYTRAKTYKDLGIKLKDLEGGQRGNRIDVAAMNKIAEEVLSVKDTQNDEKNENTEPENENTGAAA